MSRLAQVILHLPDPTLEKDAEAPKLSMDEAIQQVDVSPLPRPPLSSPSPSAAKHRYTATVQTAFAQIQASSVRAHLLASSFYLKQKDYELVIDTAEAGLASTKRLEADIGRQLTG